MIVSAILRSRPKLHRYALRLTNNRDDAEDLTQDVLIRAITNASKFRGDESMVSGWCHSIMFNLFTMQYRSKKVRQRIARFISVESTDNHTDEVFTRFEIPYPCRGSAFCALFDLERALRSLSKDQREAIELHRLCGLDYAEIARAQGVALGTVKSRIARAQAQLDQLVEA